MFGRLLAPLSSAVADVPGAQWLSGLYQLARDLDAEQGVEVWSVAPIEVWVQKGKSGEERSERWAELKRRWVELGLTEQVARYGVRGGAALGVAYRMWKRRVVPNRSEVEDREVAQTMALVGGATRQQNRVALLFAGAVARWRTVTARPQGRAGVAKEIQEIERRVCSQDHHRLDSNGRGDGRSVGLWKQAVLENTFGGETWAALSRMGRRMAHGFSSRWVGLRWMVLSMTSRSQKGPGHGEWAKYLAFCERRLAWVLRQRYTRLWMLWRLRCRATKVQVQLERNVRDMVRDQCVERVRQGLASMPLPGIQLGDIMNGIMDGDEIMAEVRMGVKGLVGKHLEESMREVGMLGNVTLEHGR